MNYISISSQVADDFYNRSLVVGTSEIAIPNSAQALTQGVQIRAANANAGIIYVGGTNVTADSNPETDGFPILAGEGLFIPIDDMNKLKLIASMAGQKLFWFAI